MKILLPCKDYDFGDEGYEIRDWILYIHRPTVFKSAMYKITYMCYGKDECYFCHRKLKPNMNNSESKDYFRKITLDHLIPQEFGGLTIPNNMRPACENCNSSKGNYFPDEFEMLRKLSEMRTKEGLKKKKAFKEEVKKIQEKRREGTIESIPEEWLDNTDISKVISTIWVGEGFGSEYKKQRRAMSEHKYNPKIIIVSKNNYVLDGFYTLIISKMEKRKPLIAKAENIIYDGFELE